MKNREWSISLGNGKVFILVFTRKDYNPLSYEEWECTLKPFYNDAHFLIIDVAEKFIQEENKSFTIKSLSKYIFGYLKDNNILPDMIWGFSMGGMICQELKQYDSFKNIPMLLISTNLYATKKLQAIFSTWYMCLENGGYQNFYQSFYPWIISNDKLPFFNTVKKDIVDIPMAKRKLLYSLKAVAMHNGINSIQNNKGKIYILFGEKSTLLDKEDMNIFKKYIPTADIVSVKDVGMRILSAPNETTINLIKKYIDEVKNNYL